MATDLPALNFSGGSLRLPGSVRMNLSRFQVPSRTQLYDFRGNAIPVGQRPIYNMRNGKLYLKVDYQMLK